MRPNITSIEMGVGALRLGGVVSMSLLCVGCVIMDEDGDKEVAGPPQSETVTWSPEPDDTGTEVSLPSVSVTWGDSALRVELTDPGSWQLGMAETGGSCGGAVSCWTGEDCFRGFTSSEGTAVGPYCHGLEDGLTELKYGGDIYDLEEGMTAFQPDFSGTVTYLLIPSDDTQQCLSFGDDPSYFSSLGCQDLAP